MSGKGEGWRLRILSMCTQQRVPPSLPGGTKRRRSSGGTRGDAKKKSEPATTTMSEADRLSMNQVWVCCGTCSKWFSLPVHLTQRDIPERWVCHMAWWITPAPICCNGTTDADEDEECLPRDPSRRHSRSWRTSIAGHSSGAAITEQLHKRFLPSSQFVPSVSGLLRTGLPWGWSQRLAALPRPLPALPGLSSELRSPASHASSGSSEASTHSKEPLSLTAGSCSAALARDVLRFGFHCVGDSTSSVDAVVYPDPLSPDPTPATEISLAGDASGAVRLVLRAMLTPQVLRELVRSGGVTAALAFRVLLCDARAAVADAERTSTAPQGLVQSKVQELPRESKLGIPACLCAALCDPALGADGLPDAAAAVEERLMEAAAAGLIFSQASRTGGVTFSCASRAYQLPPSSTSSVALPPKLRGKGSRRPRTCTLSQAQAPVCAAEAPSTPKVLKLPIAAVTTPVPTATPPGSEQGADSSEDEGEVLL